MSTESDHNDPNGAAAADDPPAWLGISFLFCA